MNLWKVYMRDDSIVDRIEKCELIDSLLSPDNINELGWGKVFSYNSSIPSIYFLDLDIVFIRYGDYDPLIKQVRNLYREQVINIFL